MHGWGKILPALLPPASVVCEGYVFTGVCLSTGGICLCSRGNVCHTHTHTHTRADTPLPSACWDTHTPAQCMLGYTHPPCPVHAGIHTRPCLVHVGIHTPPAQCMLGYMPPPSAQCMLGYDQQAGGTHPTGMHSCGSFTPSPTPG